MAVVGVGRMGRHHARTYKQMDEAELVAVVDTDEDRAATVADEYGCAFYTDTAALLADHADLLGVSVAVPTIHHEAAAKPLLERKIACLVEKPLAQSVADARHLADLATKCDAVLQVGHTERFNPAVRAVAAMDIRPRFMEVDRVSPMTFRSLDVGVVMDMMIHDLDIILMLADAPIEKVDAAGVAVLGEHEDMSSARLVFANGCVANLTASRLALKTERKLRIFSESAYVSLNYQNRDGIVIRKTDSNTDVLQHVREQVAAGKDLTDLDYTEMIEIENLTMDLPDEEADPLTAELSSFLESARSGTAPVVTAEAGYAAVDAAERVVEAMRRHKWEGRNSLKL